jgi:hypothetical protein
MAAFAVKALAAPEVTAQVVFGGDEVIKQMRRSIARALRRKPMSTFLPAGMDCKLFESIRTEQ